MVVLLGCSHFVNNSNDINVLVSVNEIVFRHCECINIQTRVTHKLYGVLDDPNPINSHRRIGDRKTGLSSTIVFFITDRSKALLL